MYDTTAGHQLGLVTTRQLLLSGLTEQEIRTLVDRRLLTRERHGVYRCAGAPARPEHPVLAACLAGGSKVVASRRGATLVLRLDGFVCKQPEVTAWGGSHPRLQGVLVHRVHDLPGWQRTIVNDVPVTTPARTIVDLAGERPDEVLGRSIDDAKTRKILTYAEILRCADGRREMQQIHRLMERRLNDRADTSFEDHVYWVISQAGLPLPVPQLQAVVPEGVYLLDHGYPAPFKIDVEIKGFDHEINRTVFDRDSFRKVRLRRAGWLQLEITTAWTDRDIAEETRAALTERGWTQAA